MTKKRKKSAGVGSVMSAVIESIEYAERFAPSMQLIAATLLPFDDRVLTWKSGPQPQSKRDDKDDPPYIEIEVPHSQCQNSSVSIKITESSVTYCEFITCVDCDGVLSDGEQKTTLEKVFKYLESLPSSPNRQLFEGECEL
jgi:hypothetical protein